MMETMEKKYELRELKAHDFFLVTRIMNKIGVKEFKRCFEDEDVKEAIRKATSENGEFDLSAVGISVAFEIAGVILEHLESCEKDIYQLLFRLSGMSVAEIEDMKMADFAEMVIEVVKHEGFRDFFTAVIKQFK